MKHTKRISTAAALTASAFLVSACSSGTTPDTTKIVADGKSIVNKDKWPEKIPTSGLTKNLTLPLEEYMASYEDQVAIEQAATDLQQSCMKEYGIELTLPRAGANPLPATTMPTSNAVMASPTGPKRRSTATSSLRRCGSTPSSPCVICPMSRSRS